MSTSATLSGKVLNGCVATPAATMFCPKCSSLLIRKDSKFACSNPTCGYEREKGGDERSVSTIDKTQKNKSMETLVLDDVTGTLPKTKIDCPKCGHLEAFWIMRQTRAADEPTTRIYRCAKCGNTWREY